MINRNITFHEVLYAPTFKYNLLSISKLCKQHHCLAIFIEDCCLVQALSMKRLQVLGKNHGGLYLLEHESYTQNGNSLSRISESCISDNKASSIVSFTDKVQPVCNGSPQHDIAFV